MEQKQKEVEQVFGTKTGTKESAGSIEVVLGPRPYNRFLGNPPANQTPDEAFEAETGYAWIQEINLQPLRDSINKLIIENNDLKKQIADFHTKIMKLQQDLQHKLQAQDQSAKKS